MLRSSSYVPGRVSFLASVLIVVKMGILLSWSGVECCWQCGTTVSVDTICSTGSEGGGVFGGAWGLAGLVSCIAE